MNSFAWLREERMSCRSLFSIPQLSFAILLLLQLTSWSQRIGDLDIVPRSNNSTMPITLRAHANEVDLVFTVTDHKGRFVSNLKASDLTIIDNDAKQTAISFFQSATDLPLRIAILLDVSASVNTRFDVEQGAIYSFLKTVVRPDDSAALFAFNEGVQLVVPAAEKWTEVRKRVKDIAPLGETAIYDAVVSASEWLSADDRPVRRLMILVTDGEENSSHVTLDESISAALKAEASIYCVNIEEDFSDPDARQGRKVLKQIADQTGGAYLQARKDEDTAEAFAKIGLELRNQYAIAYRPSNIAEQTFHRLIVLAPHKLRVRCRLGYFVR